MANVCHADKDVVNVFLKINALNAKLYFSWIILIIIVYRFVQMEHIITLPITNVKNVEKNVKPV